MVSAVDGRDPGTLAGLEANTVADGFFHLGTWLAAVAAEMSAGTGDEIGARRLLDVADRVVGLAGGRLTASEVLDLAASGPVRRRFGLDDDDLATMTRWVSDSGIRWGYDQAGRAPFALDVEPQGTWRFGLDRLLVGVTVSADGRRTSRRASELA